jgi:hypothetical protein
MRIWGVRTHMDHFNIKRTVTRLMCLLQYQKKTVYISFFFNESMAAEIVYLDMLQECIMPKLEEDVQNLILIIKLGCSQMKYFLIDGLGMQAL